MLGAILGGATGALSGVFGGLSKNRKLKKQMKMVNEMKKNNQNWYDRRYNEDATQRADAQAILTRTADMIKQRNQAAAGAAAVMGNSDESIAAEKAANANVLANVASNIAIAGDQRKDAIERQYRAKDEAYNEALINLQGQKKNALDIVSDGLGGAYSGMSEGYGLFNKDEDEDE